jgi:hypothetical protein
MSVWLLRKEKERERKKKRFCVYDVWETDVTKIRLCLVFVKNEENQRDHQGKWVSFQFLQHL